MSPVTLPLHRRWERLVLLQADRLVFTNPVAATQTQQRCPPSHRHKFRVIPHAIPDELSVAPAVGTTEGPVLAHVGKLYGDRSPEPLLKALAEIRRQGGLPAATRLVFVGWMEPHYLELITAHGLADITSVTGQVSYEESLAWMRRAHVLVTIDAESRVPSPFVPSKIMDYLAFGTPILNVTSPGSASASMMDEVGGFNVFIGDEQGSQHRLRELLSAGPYPNARLAPRQEQVRRYSSTTAGEALDAVIQEVLRPA